MADQLARSGPSPGGSQIRVVTDIRGRLRLRLPAAMSDPRLEDTVLSRDGVVACTWTPRTRSLLVLYRPEVTTSTNIRRAVDERITQAGPHARSTASSVSNGPPPIAAAIRRTVSELNTSLARLTRGALDLGTALPVILTLFAVREVARGQAGPLAWSTALWYAHGLFLDYNPRPASENQGPASESPVDAV